VNRRRLPGGLRDHVEGLLGSQWPSRWKMPDLPVCFPRAGENQQPV
jgi:hypothetical protein